MHMGSKTYRRCSNVCLEDVYEVSGHDSKAKWTVGAIMGLWIVANNKNTTRLSSAITCAKSSSFIDVAHVLPFW